MPIQPAPEQPKKEALPICMADGSQSTITVFSSEAKSNPVCVIMPAMGVRASYYEPLATALCQKGFHAVTADLRGHGESSLRSSRAVDFGFHEMSTFDLPAVVNKVKAHFPRSPVYLLGHSLGGQMSVLYASLYPGEVAGIILVSTCSVYFRGWTFPTNLIILLGTQLAWGISILLGYYPGNKLGFGGREARTMVRDWSRNSRTGHYEPANSNRDMEAEMAKMTTPVLAISIAGDHLAPPRAVRYLCEKLRNSRVRYLHIEDDVMPAAGQDHFKWVCQANVIIDNISQWMTPNPHR